MFGIATDRGCRAATPAPLLWRQRFLAGRPQAGGGLDADDIGQADLCDAVTELCVGAVSRVGQGDLGFDPHRDRTTKLIERDLWLGPEDDIVRHACLSTPGRIIGPLMREIQTIGDWQAA